MCDVRVFLDITGSKQKKSGITDLNQKKADITDLN
jgi:hypothetical protein